MRISRRGLGTVAVGVAVGLVAGCRSTDPGQERLEWLSGLDGVERAELVKDGDDDLILLTLVKKLPQDDVKALADKVKWEFRSYDKGYFRSIEVDLDGFHGRFYPSASTKNDPDLARALWLREDGRATASAYGASGLVITAPARSVAAVALGVDGAVPSEDGRRTHRVESSDRLVVVEWTNSVNLGFRLDRRATQEFADLQARYAGLTGWIEGPEHRAGIYFAASDLTLDVLLAAPPKAEVFGKLELGWGLVRAPHTVFATAFTPQVRALTAELAKVPGVTSLDIRDDEGEPDPASVTVKDRAGYVAAVTTLRRLWDSYLPIQLIREPSPYVGRTREPVFRTSAYDQDREFRIHAALADLAGLVRVQIGPEAANLTILPDISDPELTAALRAMAQLAATHTIRLYASYGADETRLTQLGKIVNRKYSGVNPVPPAVGPALISRLTTTWALVSR
ncbi:hypothetical protein [Kribbella italica]|uniref:Uncharacterized protein n=1 Tax=Kribbella italica TaxID=1540520 RepID=A0A7W9J6D8_9ACTN|nr:hypothetical protein [Kribbella italica]MBB5836199.1 hypothetical protein [Kribbella italica]